jgi:ABC-type multidrug transport system fused ATPase/permease subunit
MTTVEKCSRIAVIEDGIVVEEGSFNSLQNKQDGVFNQLAKGLKK